MPLSAPSTERKRRAKPKRLQFLKLPRPGYVKTFVGCYPKQRPHNGPCEIIGLNADGTLRIVIDWYGEALEVFARTDEVEVL